MQIKKKMAKPSMTESPESTLSTKMAASRPSTDVINLGKQLAKELALDNTCETLSKWMAHLLAEKINAAENAIPDSEERRTLEQQAVDLILRLWERRYSLPPRVSPFGQLQKLIEYLTSLQDRTTNAWPWVRYRHQEQSAWQELDTSIAEFSGQVRPLLMLSDALLEIDADPLAWEKQNQRMLEYLELDALRLLNRWIEEVDQMRENDAEPETSQAVSKEDKIRKAIAQLDQRFSDLQARIVVFKDKVLATPNSATE